MDMVERVAKKIARMVPINGSEWCEGHGHNFPREYHRDDVLLILAISRAAIEAMREPTDGMMQACWPIYHPWKENAPPPSMRPESFEAMKAEVTAYWTAVIDSILKSTRETA